MPGPDPKKPLAVRHKGVLYPARVFTVAAKAIYARAYGDPFKQVSNNQPLNYRNLNFDKATGLSTEKAYPETELINVDADMLDADVDPDTGFERKVPISEARRMAAEEVRKALADTTVPAATQRIVLNVSDGGVDVVSIAKVS